MVMGENPESAVAVESDVKIGSVFAGRYRILGLLGEGDRKRTYLAEDKSLGRKVALALIKEAAECGPSQATQE
jgi:hypothetical protein